MAAQPPQDPIPIEDVLGYMVRTRKLIHLRQKGLVLMEGPLLEAHARYMEARAAYRRICDDEDTNLNLIAHHNQDMAAISAQYGETLRGYASQLNPAVVECASVDDLYRVLVLREWGDYFGYVQIPDNNPMLARIADELGLPVLPVAPGAN